MMKKNILITVTIMLGCLSLASANDLISKSPDNAKVYFISPKNNQEVTQKFKVQFGLSGMGVAPAGTNAKNTGHHHILIDMDIASLDLSKPLPATDKVQHFGGGQTEVELMLSPGKHSLQLLLGNYVHIPHNKPVVSKKITVYVK